MIVSRPSPKVALPTEKDLVILPCRKGSVKRLHAPCRFLCVFRNRQRPSIRLTLSRNELGELVGDWE
jgi:hypothetical protein